MNSITRIPKFRRCVLQNFPFIEQDFDALTDYELLCKVVEYLNKVIDSQNEVTEQFEQLVSAFNTLQSYVETYFDNLDVQEEINNKLDEMAEDGTLIQLIMPYLPKSEQCTLYAFFDTTNSDKINFYVSEDMLHLRKLNIDSSISGRDPSLFYKNGKFYVAITNYTSSHDFSIFESTDLQNWTRHDINLGLYNPTYPKIWAPQWFEDGDNKIYILFSRQYANTEGSGDFETYITECTDLDSLTFASPTKVTLSGNTDNNYIDACVFKENGIYNLILKNEHQGVMRLSRFTSSTISGTFTLVDEDYGKLGYRFEGEFIVKSNDKYYLYAENYSANITPPSAYFVAESIDGGLTFGNKHLIQTENDLSHGSGIYCNEELSKVIKNIDNFTPKFTNEFIDDITSYIACFDTYASGSPLANYVKLFSIKPTANYRSITLDFSLSNYTSGRSTINSDLHFVLYTSALDNPTSYYTFINETARSIGEVGQINPSNVFGKVICYYNSTDGVYDVVLDISEITQNMAVGVNIFQVNNGGNYKIIKHQDDLVDTIGTEVTANARDTHKSKSPFNPRCINLDNGNNNTATIKMVCSNGVARLFGEENGTAIAKIVNDLLAVQAGSIVLHKLNSSSTSTISVNVTDFTNNIYTFVLSGLTPYSGLTLELPDHYANAILSIVFSNV